MPQFTEYPGLPFANIAYTQCVSAEDWHVWWEQIGATAREQVVKVASAFGRKISVDEIRLEEFPVRRAEDGLMLCDPGEASEYQLRWYVPIDAGAEVAS